MTHTEKMRLYFKNRDISQKEISKKTGQAPAMISRYLSGASSFSSDFIAILIREFPDIDLNYIFSVKENNEANEPNELYGLTNEIIDKEMEIIQDKLAIVRKYLAQNRHKK